MSTVLSNEELDREDEVDLCLGPEALSLELEPVPILGFLAGGGESSL